MNKNEPVQEAPVPKAKNILEDMSMQELTNELDKHNKIFVIVRGQKKLWRNKIVYWPTTHNLIPTQPKYSIIHYV